VSCTACGFVVGQHVCATEGWFRLRLGRHPHSVAWATPSEQEPGTELGRQLKLVSC
jgi:hypothetical protein